MGERPWNGGGYVRRHKGSERRGVFPVRDLSSVAESQKQSHEDKQRLREKILEREQERRHLQEQERYIDFGNKELPAYKHKDEIVAAIEQHRAVILGGKTGSGKSTQVPQFLYEAGYTTIVFLPRRIIADGLADRLREEMAEHIGIDSAQDAVGVVHGERSDWDIEKNKIIVMTSNTYIRMERELSQRYNNEKLAIISDEIHEANLFTDIATGVAASEVTKHENWRLVAASATHNAADLETPFSRVSGGFVPKITIEGRPFDVEMREASESNSMDVYAQIGHDHKNSMIFTSGKREIDHIINGVIDRLERTRKGSSSDVVFRKLHAELTDFEISHVKDPVPEGKRLLIVSSPAGMSGITIPGVTFTISDGTINRQELDEEGYSGLLRHYLSRAEVTQQAGRAGRDVPGGLFVLTKPTAVVEDAMEKKGLDLEYVDMPFVSLEDRPAHAPPEIYSNILSRVVLGVANTGRHFGDINPFLPHPVDGSAIRNAEEALARIGALDDNNDITELGRRMDRFPIAPELARGIVEAERRQATLQQLTRIAFIAAAVEVGGLQDFSRRGDRPWRGLVRPSSDDDFLAQLDLASEVFTRTDEVSQQYFIAEHDLHAKRIERGQKVARKILRTLSIHMDNVIMTPSTEDEDAELREYLTAGMTELVYRQEAQLQKRIFYKNIHSDSEAKRRYIGSRTVVGKLPKTQLVAGFPRWFDKKTRSGDPERQDVIEMLLRVDPEVVGRYALQNGLLQGRPVKPRLEGDRVVEREQPMFGDIPVGDVVTTTQREVVPEASRKMLLDRILSQPREAQLQLRAIAEELEWYQQSIPSDELARYRKSDEIQEITKESIKELIYGYTVSIRDASGIEAALSDYIYKKNVTIGRYYDDSARLEMRQRSPRMITIHDMEIPVRYDNGQPYVTGLVAAQKRHITEALYLDDGREVLIQVAKSGSGTRRISGAELH